MSAMNMTDVHYNLLEKKFGVTREKFEEMLQEDGDELEELFDKLAVEEVDDKVIEEIVDAISDWCAA